ncbi:NUDIX domain-containing protein [Candidatus Saccharibacteria bacterium]|nr:NUDIX domain-containing protein [Candidatus Saccharibacteria bacterium]
MSRERVCTVNDKGEITGEKWRDELLDTDIWRIAMIWVKDTEGNHLLEQRALTKEIHPGTWTPACVGTVTATDTPLETAVRELEEEIGLDVKPEDLKVVGSICYKDPQHGSRYAFAYLLTIAHQPAESFSIQKEELEQVKWYTDTEISQLHSEHPELIPIYEQYQKLGFIS